VTLDTAHHVFDLVATVVIVASWYCDVRKLRRLEKRYDSLAADYRIAVFELERRANASGLKVLRGGGEAGPKGAA
jgi:hypothetical protein